MHAVILRIILLPCHGSVSFALTSLPDDLEMVDEVIFILEDHWEVVVLVLQCNNIGSVSTCEQQILNIIMYLFICLINLLDIRSSVKLTNIWNTSGSEN